MGERFEDVFTEVMKKFFSMIYFKEFAHSGNGLALDIYDVTTIVEDNPNSVEDQKHAMLGLWRERNAARATPGLLRETVQRYLIAETPDGNERRLEDAFLKVPKKFHSADQFKQFALSNQGLSLSMREVGNIKDNFTSVEEQNYEMLKLWKLKKGDLATVNRIWQLVDEFLHGLGGSGQVLGNVPRSRGASLPLELHSQEVIPARNLDSASRPAESSSSISQPESGPSYPTTSGNHRQKSGRKPTVSDSAESSSGTSSFAQPAAGPSYPATLGLGSPSPFILKAREFLTGLMYRTFSHEER